MDAESIGTLLDRRMEAYFPSRGEVCARLAGGTPLHFYAGFDPTGPSLHIGHTIALFVLKQLAAAGHRITFLIGDFTARIGDPTGKLSARTALSTEQVAVNMELFASQAERILAPQAFEIRHNSEWNATMTFADVIRLASLATVQQMLVRDMFQERLKQEKPIFISEFLYPLTQGYDSVALGVDGEVGGNDQTFNMLVGRDLLKEMEGKDKIVLATRLLVDASSGRKVSKTGGSFIALADSPQEIRRKVLEINDTMVSETFRLCTEKDERWIGEHEQQEPRKFKEALADELISLYHGGGAVKEARESVAVDVAGQRLADAMVKFGMPGVTGATGAKALIRENAVAINGKPATDWNETVNTGDTIQVGKGRFFVVK